MQGVTRVTESWTLHLFKAVILLNFWYTEVFLTIISNDQTVNLDDSFIIAFTVKLTGLGQRWSSHELPWGLRVAGKHGNRKKIIMRMTFHWAFWLHTSRRNTPEAAYSSPKTLCAPAWNPHLYTSILVQYHYVYRIKRTFVNSIPRRASFHFPCWSCQDMMETFLGMHYQPQVLALH